MCVPGDRASSEIDACKQPSGRRALPLMLRHDFSILPSCQMPPSPRSLPARWCNGVCGSKPFLGNRAAQLYQVSLPQDAELLLPSVLAQLGSGGLLQGSCGSVLGGGWALGCGRAGVTWSVSPLAAAARSVPRELASPVSQKAS